MALEIGVSVTHSTDLAFFLYLDGSDLAIFLVAFSLDIFGELLVPIWVRFPS